MGGLFSSFRFEREAWIRFLIAIVGLLLAFGAALFSTVTRQSGNVLATAVFASLALLLAGFVGLTTVRLRRHQGGSRLPRHHSGDRRSGAQYGQ